MLFNSSTFILFFISVCLFYFSLNHKWQNRMLLIASYIFYGAWNWRFLSLIFISTILDYSCGLLIYKSTDRRKKKRYLFLSVAGNLSILCFFKYYNFFLDNIQTTLSLFGIPIHTATLNIVLPVGISFYTFQTMSYTIDIYRNEMKPTRHFLDFALFVAFFPQLVAGPIERAKRLLPQILKPRKCSLSDFYQGIFLIFFGLFQKVVIADNLASIVDPVFALDPPYSGFTVLIALYAFAFQIFCDFAGYSNIARGVGKCLGFDIMVNFNLPYFAANPREFWNRWHISLSTWLKDYLYIPLGGNRRGRWTTYKNLMLTMLLGGLWHGAAWTFVAWGFYQGLLLCIHRVFEPMFCTLKQNIPEMLHNLYEGLLVIIFFHLTCFGWLLFRANSLEQALQMSHALLFDLSINVVAIPNPFFFVLLIIAIQAAQYRSKNLMAIYDLNPIVKVAVYTLFYFLFVFYGVTGGKEFIYFQF